MKVHLSPRWLAVVGAVGTAALVAGAEALRQQLLAGHMPIDPVYAIILAAAIGGGVGGYTQSHPAATPHGEATVKDASMIF